MFKRRTKPSALHRTRDLVWPRIGWRRASRYVMHRLARLPGSPYSIAGGFACGAAVSFTPFIGFHFVLSALLAWGLRANILASAIGTVVGNPWTFPFIWLWIYKVGNWMLVQNGRQIDAEGLTFQHLLDHPQSLFVPMILGSIPTGIVIWFVFYWPLRYLVAAYQRRRVERRLRKRDHSLPVNGEKMGEIG